MRTRGPPRSGIGLRCPKRAGCLGAGPWTTAFLRSWFAKPVRPRVITLGNQKGGSGKSTVAMHLMVGLMSCGYRVGSLDLDGDQATLSHFMENRQRHAKSSAFPIDLPTHVRIDNSLETSVAAAEEEETEQLQKALETLIDHDYVVIDTPGNDTFLSRMGHILADCLITPMNDSFLDLDVLVRFDAEAKRIIGPSGYSIAVMDRWGLRMLVTGHPLDWIVIRNRLAHLENRNNRQVESLLEKLSPRLGFRLCGGMGERVAYRELFPKGLTLLDPFKQSLASGSAKSRAGARNEVWDLLEMIGLVDDNRARRSWRAKQGLVLDIGGRIRAAERLVTKLAPLAVRGKVR